MRITVLIVGLLVAACGTETESGTASSQNGEQATVDWIYDGDTIEVTLSGSKTDIRLLGINAPDQGECYYDEATEYLIDTLKDETVTVDVVDTDQFGRTLGYVYLNGADVNADLVSMGFAIASTPDSGSGYLNEEAEAIDGDLGLWSTEACGGGPVPAIEIDIDPFDETVIITNTGSDTVQLGGWVLRDESSRHRYGFAGTTQLAAGQTIIVASTDNGWSPGDSNVWNNDGDIGMLLDEDGRVITFQRY